MFFCTCEMLNNPLPPRRNEVTFGRGPMTEMVYEVFFFMDENVQKSCWGVTVWTVVAVGAALALVVLFNDVETAQQAVAVSQ